MVCSAVSFNLKGQNLNGHVTDVIVHDDGKITYEILADGKCHYLKESEFKVMSRSASLKGKIPQYEVRTTKEQLEYLSSTAPESMRQDIRELIDRHY